MKVGKFTSTTSKGQIVIPKEFREALRLVAGTPLHISLGENGIYIQPVESVIPRVGGGESYVSVLERSKGAWAAATRQEKSMEDGRKAAELKEARKVRTQW